MREVVHGSSPQPRNKFPPLPSARNMRKQNHRPFCSSTFRFCIRALRYCREGINLQLHRRASSERVQQRVDMKCNDELGMALGLIYKKRSLCATEGSDTNDIQQSSFLSIEWVYQLSSFSHARERK